MADSTSISSTQSNIPEWAQPYAAGLLGRAEALTDINQNPYQTYGGPRVAGLSPLEQQAFQGIAGLQPSAATQYGINYATEAAQRAGQLGSYAPTQAQNFYSAPGFQSQNISYLSTQAPNLQQYQMGPAERVQTGAFNQPGVAASYMSPYMQNVVDIQQREAQRQADIAHTQRSAQAVGQGAFGGSRQAIMDAEAARNLATQKSDIQAQGLQSAYQQAQNAYMTDAQRQLQAAQANQGAGLQTGQQNLAALLGVQQLGAQTGLQSQQLNQAAQLQAQQQGLTQNQAMNQFNLQNAQNAAQYGLQGAQLGEQSRQFGANLGLQGLQQQLAAAGQLGALGGQQFGQQTGALQAQQQAGATQRGLEQQGLEAAYQDFLTQQRYPYAQLGFMSDILRGVPSTGATQTMYQAQSAPPLSNQLMSYGLGAYGLSKLFAKGGRVKRYAKGGSVESNMGKGLPEAALHRVLEGEYRVEA